MILTIAHTKGGVGKSTLLWNIACEFSRQKKEFIVIDLDHQKTIFNLNEYVRKKSKLKVYTASNLHQLEDIFTTHKDKMILIDTGGNDAQVNKQAILQSHILITPIGNDSITEAIGFKKFEAILHELNTPKIKVVFTNIRPNTKNFQDISQVVQSYQKTDILKSVITNRQIYKQSTGQGVGVTELPQSKNKALNQKISKASNEIKELLKELEI